MLYVSSVDGTVKDFPIFPSDFLPNEKEKTYSPSGSTLASISRPSFWHSLFPPLFFFYFFLPHSTMPSQTDTPTHAHTSSPNQSGSWRPHFQSITSPNQCWALWYIIICQITADGWGKVAPHVRGRLRMEIWAPVGWVLPKSPRKPLMGSPCVHWDMDMGWQLTHTQTHTHTPQTS